MRPTRLIPRLVILAACLGPPVVAQPLEARAQLALVFPSIDERTFVTIGGIDQWISIRGQNRDNPVILVLHGGPGVSNAPFAPAFIPWEKDFTIVEWDQRGAGRTFGRNGARGTGVLSIDRLTQDGIELTQLLRSRLQKDKIVLFALSFGSVIGLKMVQARPELFAAYVASGQFINAADGDALGYRLTLEQARAVQNTEAIKSLEAMGPPPWPDVKTRSAAKGLATRMTKDDDPASQMNVLAMLKALPDYSDADLKNLPAGMAFSTEPLIRDAMSFDARSFGPRFPIPLFIFQGADDLNTPTALVQRWFADVEAPAKAIMIVEHASHGAFYTHSEQLGRFLAERVRPLAVGK
jgi:pimeloyl-ACP methyl ester carboxylesterase